MPKPLKKPTIDSPDAALQAFKAMLQQCEHTEMLAEFGSVGSAIIKHHDSYIWVNVKRDFSENYFIFNFNFSFQIDQEEILKLYKALLDELDNRVLSLFPNKLHSYGSSPGASPFFMNVDLLTPPSPEELDALKTIFDNLVSKYPIHYTGNYAESVKVAREKQKEKLPN